MKTADWLDVVASGPIKLARTTWDIRAANQRSPLRLHTQEYS